MTKLNIFLLLLLFWAVPHNCDSIVKVAKCCGDDEIYNSDKNRCEATSSGLTNTILAQIQVVASLDIAENVYYYKEKQNKLASLEKISQTSSLPPCRQYEIHKLSQNHNDDLYTVLTDNGNLLIRKYADQISQGNFCIDRNSNNELISVTCDVCHNKKCYQLCCPFGYGSLIITDEEETGRCFKNPNIKYDVINVSNQKVGDDGSNTRLIGPSDENLDKKGWRCSTENLPNWMSEPNFTLNLDGSAKAQMANSTVTWRENDYCLLPYQDVTKEDLENSDADLFIDLYTCNNGYDENGNSNDSEDWCKNYLQNTQPYILIVSIIFLLITLAFYVFNDCLRKQENKMFTHIAIGFLVNLTIAYTVLVIEQTKSGREEDDDRESVACYFKGYLTQYFFLAFFFWMNTMSYYIWKKVSTVKTKLSNEREELLRYILYSQGVPLLIVLLTVTVDTLGQENDDVNKLYLPNMAVFSCFLGRQKTADLPSYFTTPIFIYFQLYLMIIMISNFVFFVATLIHLYGSEEKRIRHRAQFMTISRLFIFMGIWWTCELITTALGTEYDFNQLCYLRLALDMPNLLSGLLIFLITVTQRKYFNNLKDKTMVMSRRSSSSETSATEFIS